MPLAACPSALYFKCLVRSHWRTICQSKTDEAPVRTFVPSVQSCAPMAILRRCVAAPILGLMKRRVAQLPLHTGKAPAWLFRRMTKLAGAITMAIVDEFGPAEMLYRLSDPWWFQAFGCVLGFDWHSSGVTTVTCGAMKEAAKLFGDDLGILVAGGKGGVSRKTPDEIDAAADRHAISSGEQLVYASRMSAKVDSAALQDGFQLYHHNFFFTPEGQWCVVQQGMNETSRWARRYHWLGERVDDFVCEPHAAIRNLADDADDSHNSGTTDDPPRDAAQTQSEGRPRFRQQTFLNMVAEEAESNRESSAAVVRCHPDWVIEQLKSITEGPTLFAPARHPVLRQDINTTRLRKLIVQAHENNPKDFETLLGTAGVGPATIRSLSLLAELIYDAPPSTRDPAQTCPPGSDETERRWADYSYAHGGKDGTPFPVDRATYDRNISVLTDAVRRARIDDNEKVNALRRLSKAGASCRPT